MDVGGAVLGSLKEDGVDEPDERNVGHAVLGLEVGDVLFGLEREQILVLVDRRAGAERLGGADELADRAHDVLARGDAELERMAGGEPELVEAVQVRRVTHGNLEAAVLEGIRDRADSLEHVQRQLSRGVLVDRDDREVDERELMTGGKHPCDALARGDALLDEGRAERASLLRTAAGQGELVLRNELRRREQVDDELDRVAHPERR